MSHRNSKIRMLFNNIDFSFGGELAEIYIEPRKSEYCRILNCRECLIVRSEWGNREYFFVGISGNSLNYDPPNWPRISVHSSLYGAPQYIGSFLIGRYDKQGKPMSLTDGDIQYLKKTALHHYKEEDGRGRWQLWIDF